MTLRVLCILPGLTALPGVAVAAGAEAIQVAPGQAELLPRGKEADGVWGDFVLRNEHVVALVAADLPRRKANMGTNWDAITPGGLYDLAVRGSENDQLTNFAPGGLQGPVSSVRIVADGSDGVAIVRVERTAARGDGLHTVHDYRLRPGDRHVEVHSVYVNRSDAPIEIQPAPAVKGLVGIPAPGGIACGNSQNPADRQGYAWSLLPGEDAATSLASVKLAPGEATRYRVAVAPARSPAAAWSILRSLREPTGELRLRVTGPGEKPVPTASVELQLGDRTVKTDDGEARKEELWVPAYPGGDGIVSLALPAGAYRLRVRDLGRPEVSATTEVRRGEVSEVTVALDDAARIRVIATDASGKPTPAKAQFIGVEGTPDPHFGVDIQARGCRNQYHSASGDFTVKVDPGKYRVVVTHGIEYDHHEANVIARRGAAVVVRAMLRRVVDTRGWISTDYHNHSTPSGDNYCGTDDRIINLAAEQVEFAPATEHNRIYDWGPHIRKLGLADRLATTIGIELTGPNAHFNAFPLTPNPYLQDNGAPQWVHDPRINAINLRDFPGPGTSRWVHLNHPNVGEFFRDRDKDGRADGGYPGLARLIDAAEVWSTEILNLAPSYPVSSAENARRAKNRTFEWLQLLNQGVKMYCLAVSDAHSVFGNGVGGWRTYVKSSTDDVSRIDVEEIIRNSKAGRMIMTNGPYLEVEVEGGAQIGSTVRLESPFEVKIRVQTNSWIDIDRVQILVNGRAPEKLDFRADRHPGLFVRHGSVRFAGSVSVELEADAHLIVVAHGEGFDLSTGYGKSWQSGMHPCAFTNPIFVDIDGNGFEPSGDTLGYPLPLAPVHQPR